MRDFIEPSFRDLTERYYEMGMELQSITDPVEHQKFLLRLADMTKEMEIKHWLEQPVPPFIGGWNAMSMKEELVVFLDRTMETKELKRSCQNLFLRELMFKLGKKDTFEKWQKSVPHMLAVIRTAKDNNVDIYA